jgi:hypothetical protein
MQPEVAAQLLALLELLVDERVELRLRARGRAEPREYCSRGPLPAGTSARVFRAGAVAMLKANEPGVRREGRARRDRVYFVDVDVWHRWRTASRAVVRHEVAQDDEELAAAALEGAGLRVVRGGRR